MYFRVLIFFVFLSVGHSFGQELKKIEKSSQNLAQRDSLQQNNTSVADSKKITKPEDTTIDLYLILNRYNDSTYVDTTLSQKKLYKFNYLQQDNFNLISFANLGQTYNTLSFNSAREFGDTQFGARGRHFNYLDTDAINYYEVPTPWTRLTYKTAFQQGQLLDAFFTTNLSKQFNVSIAYKGLRSIGNYINALTSSGNLRLTTNYKTKNNRYRLKSHMVWQDLLNEENGGIRDEDIINFTSGNPDFLDRPVFDPNLNNAESILVGKRFYINQEFDLIKQKDSSAKNKLSIKHSLTFEDKFFEYNQTSANSEFFGEAFTNRIKNRVTLEDFNTTISATYNNTLLGQIELGVGYTDLNYGYNSVVFLVDNLIPNRIKTNFLSTHAAYSKTINGFTINGEAGINLSDDFEGNYIKGHVSYNLNEDVTLGGSLSVTSARPNFNFLLYQSDYLNYNWYNFDRFDNVNTQQIAFTVRSPKYVNLSFDLSNIDNFTYFNLEDQIDTRRIIKPKQYQNTLQYLRVKLQKDIRVGKFGLDNTIMYQNVTSDDNVLNVPDVITRNTLYFKDEFFKKAMIFQTGVVFNYFTAYNMNGYDPFLAEFYTQNETELGGFPRLDAFVSAKIRQTRVFLIAEHFNSGFTGYDYFSAPNHPYRDFVIRFGLVWDFFL